MIALRVTVLVFLLLVRAAVGLSGEHGEDEYLIVPKGYTPEKSWPLMIVSQNQVSGKAMAAVPYFAAYGGPDRAQILEVAKKYNIDPYRVYGTGFSRSGHGLLEYTWSYPHTFAAIAPVCEDMREKEQYGKRQKIDQLKYIQTPTYLWHGDHDSFLASGKKNYELMKDAGCPVQFGTYPGGHGPDPIYFNDIRKLTDFFDRHVLDPYPKHVIHVVYAYAATRAFWIDARVAKGSVENEYPVVEVQVKDGNVIDVVRATDGVRKLDFYLCDKLVDMAKPVTVSFGGKEVYKGAAERKLTVTLRDGEVNPQAGETPLWELIEALRSEPNETGAMDWLFLDLHTSFADPRLGRPVARRIGLDLGFRAADGPATAKITPASRAFRALTADDANAADKFDFSALEKKLSLEVSTSVKCLGLAGSVDDPQGADPIRLVPADQAKSGLVVLVRVKVANKGERDVAGVAKLGRSPFMSYPIGLWPPDDKGDFVKGIYEVAATRGIQWQFFFSGHNNWPYQVLGFFMLNPGGLGKVTAQTVPVYRSPVWCAQRTLTVKAGAVLENPLLLISVPSSDPKSDKPKVPDLGKIVDQLKAELVKAIRD